VAVEYPDHDGPGAQVTVRMRVKKEYASRIYANATAQVYSNGMLGAKVISIQPGDPAAGALADNRLRGVKALDINEVAAEVRDLAKDAKSTSAEVRDLAKEAKQLAKDTRATMNTTNDFIKEIKDGNGTLAKLLRDDDLYKDMRDTLADTRKLIARTDKAVAALEGEITDLHGLVVDGRSTLASVKQGADAVKALPVIRSYVTDTTAQLVRPGMTRHRWAFESDKLFEPGTSKLTYDGQVHMNNMASILKTHKQSGSEVVVVVMYDPNAKGVSADVALEITKKQAEEIASHFRTCDVHKLGTISRRKIVPIGIGMALSPIEPEQNGPSQVQIHLFVPK
jgi:phospholipid/cholesterol/gamma-HCH transport system substrate-binding protein